MRKLHFCTPSQMTKRKECIKKVTKQANHCSPKQKPKTNLSPFWTEYKTVQNLQDKRRKQEKSPIPQERYRQIFNQYFHLSFGVPNHMLVPPTGVSALSWWWGLGDPVISSAMPAVAYVLTGSPIPDRSRARFQIKTDISLKKKFCCKKKNALHL
jgi:hypothetical protein